MSSLTTLARPYAKAAFGLAQDSKPDSDDSALAHWQSMLVLASQIAANEQVAEVLESPLVSPAQAVDLIGSAGGEKFDENFKAYLGVLGANRRLPLLPEIAALFARLKQQAERQLQVRVVSATPLDDDQVKRMSEALAKRFDCAIELDSEIDPSVLGGAVIYAGDQVIDGSLRGRLDKLTNALSR
jgi:F-type H+-transporting ATPase subunit delta